MEWEQRSNLLLIGASTISVSTINANAMGFVTLELVVLMSRVCFLTLIQFEAFSILSVCGFFHSKNTYIACESLHALKRWSIDSNESVNVTKANVFELQLCVIFIQCPFQLNTTQSNKFDNFCWFSFGFSLIYQSKINICLNRM